MSLIKNLLSRDHYSIIYKFKWVLRNKNRANAGFTIVELLIATSVFSVILIIASAAIIKIGQTYTKGMIAGRTQEVARSVMDEISRSIQFNGGEVKAIASPSPVGPIGPVYGFCIDNRRYSYVLDRQLTDGTPDPTQSKNVFVVDEEGCGDPVPTAQEISGALTATSRELLAANMRLDYDPLPTPLPCATLCTVTLKVVYGHNDVLEGGPLNYKCLPNSDGGQFCSISRLSSTVVKRVQ